jgi:hypothetical protein
MNRQDVHRITSIGRPLEPGYATNRAVLFLMPLAGVIAALVKAAGGGSGAVIASAGVVAALAVFGTWALGRELAPDRNASAFVCMALGFGVLFVAESASLLTLFVTLFLVRIVNRSVGLPARLTDSIVVVSLVFWAVYDLSGPWFAVVAAMAFCFDAMLPEAHRRQLLFAIVCLAGFWLWNWQVGSDGVDIAAPGLRSQLAVSVVTLGFLITIARTKAVASLADATAKALTPARVQAGMLVALLMALQSLLLGSEGVQDAGLVWASLAGVSIGSMR